MGGSRKSLELQEYCANYAIALLLYSAAFAKVASGLAAGLSVSDGRSTATNILAASEVLLGTWLLLPRYILVRWFVVSFTFAVFFLVSLWKFLGGKTNCGCFGGWNVPPVAMALTDAASLMVLTASGWRSSRGKRGRRLILFPLSAAMLSAVTIGAYSLYPYGKLNQEPRILRTEDWPGKTFPIVDDIPSKNELRRGSWVVLLYHAGCEKCSLEMQRFNALANNDKMAIASPRLAAIEIPPYGSDNEPVQGESRLKLLRLRDDRAWFVATPQVIYLRDGLVLRVADHLDGKG